MLREKSSRNPVFAVPHVEAAKRIRVETSDAPPFPPPLPLSHLVIVSSSTSEVSIGLVTNISSRSSTGLVIYISPLRQVCRPAPTSRHSGVDPV